MVILSSFFHQLKANGNEGNNENGRLDWDDTYDGLNSTPPEGDHQVTENQCWTAL